MPIIIPKNLHEDPLFSGLARKGAAVIPEHLAKRQDIRPARIGLLNLMPATAMNKTEEQWLAYLSHTVLQIEPVLIKFDNDTREGLHSSRKEILSRYTSFSQAKAVGLDGLIITGDNLELQPNVSPPTLMELIDIRYSDQLTDVITYARKHIYSTIYSCLASHFALNQLYGLHRSIGSEKICGVYSHKVLKETSDDIVLNMNDVIYAPHSRWGSIPAKALQAAKIRMLAENSEIGWLLAKDKNESGGSDYFIQGHPEYDKLDLDEEYKRDVSNGQSIPQNYYEDNNPQKEPIMSWVTDARALHSNWIDLIYKHFSTRDS